MLTIQLTYGLWWNSANLIQIASEIKRNLQGKENVFVLKKGFYSLFGNRWQRNIKLIFNINVIIIESINRFINDKDHPIEIKYRNLKTNKDEIAECDVLFTAVDLSTFMDSFDAQKDEKEVFGDIKSYTLCACLCEWDIEPNKESETRGVSLFAEKLLKNDGGLYAIRNSSLIINKERDWKIVKEKELKRERSVTYQFRDTMSIEIY